VKPLDYQRAGEKNDETVRRAPNYDRVIGLSLVGLILFPFIVAGILIGVRAYVDAKYSGITVGMKQAAVDKHLGAFTATPNTPYQGLGRGQYIIRYELFGWGKKFMISVIYEADGRVSNPIPAD
jgi:hypothetical protein